MFTLTELVPGANGWTDVGVKLWSVFVVPHSNHAFVAVPFGLMLPISVAPSPANPPAASVVTEGGLGTVDVNAIVKIGFQLFVPALWSLPMVVLTGVTVTLELGPPPV